MDGCSCVVLCLCGLPGTGKSTIAKLLSQNASSLCWGGITTPNVWHVCYDDYEDALAEAKDEIFDTKIWKKSREEAHQELERILREHNNSVDGGESRHLVVVDDNMYYRSMRHGIFQVARKYGAGFVQLYVKVPLEVAIQQNRQRARSVPVEVMERMAGALQPPDPKLNHWEHTTVTVYPHPESDAAESHDSLLQLLRAELLPVLKQQWFAPVPPAPALTEEEILAQEATRKANLRSLLHQSELVLRKQIGVVMQAWSRAQKDWKASAPTLPATAAPATAPADSAKTKDGSGGATKSDSAKTGRKNKKSNVQQDLMRMANGIKADITKEIKRDGASSRPNSGYVFLFADAISSTDDNENMAAFLAQVEREFFKRLSEKLRCQEKQQDPGAPGLWVLIGTFEE